MQLGMNMLLWTTFVTEEHFPLFAKLKAAGFDGVEIPLPQGDEAHWKRVREELDRVGLDCTTVTSVDDSMDPISDDPAVRAKGAEQLEWAVEMSEVLRSNVLCGPFHSAYKQFAGRGPTDEELDRSCEVMRRVGAKAQEKNVVLAVEPLNRFETYLMNTAAQSRAYLERCDHPAVKILYDTHHAHIEENDSCEAIRTLGVDGIGHVHVSENNRGTPGRGQVDFAGNLRTLREIGYDGWLVIESFSRLDPDFAGAIHIWRDFFESPDEVYTEGGKFIRDTWNG